MSGTSKCIFVANCLRIFELCLLDLSILVRAVFSTRAPPPHPGGGGGGGGGGNKLLPCFFKSRDEISFDQKKNLHGKNERVSLENSLSHSTSKMFHV